MATFDEYRHPWETGPHWELKREFMEKYKNDYPLDRLLCLAQAYSNIELLHCSYPEPVEREVYQLSCQLKGCKRFREAAADLERRKKEKLEMQPRKAGKRSLSDEIISTKPFKFIKFRSSAGASDEPESNNQPVENSNDFTQQDAESSARASNEPESNNQSVQNSNDFMQQDTESSAKNDRTSVDSEDSSKNSASKDAVGNDVVLTSSNNTVIFSLSRSPDFGLMQKIAAAIPKRSCAPIKKIESAVDVIGLENAIKYGFVCEDKSVFFCQFYVGSTLVATGRESTANKAKIKAVEYGVEILNNLSNLPHKTLEDVKQELEKWKAANPSQLWSQLQSSSDFKLKSKLLMAELTEMGKNPAYSDLHLILSLTEKLYDEKYLRNKSIHAVQKIQEVASKLNCFSQVHFFHFGEEPDTPFHERIFHCDFVVKNIYICRSKGTSKKKSKVAASEEAVRLFMNLIENCDGEKQQNVQNGVESFGVNLESSATDMSTNGNINNSLRKGSSSSADAESSKSSTNKNNELNKLFKAPKAENYTKSPVADNLSQMHNKTFLQSNEYNNQGSSGLRSKPKLFRINHKLLNNSRNLQLIIYDLSETSCQNAASSILHVSATRCKQNLNYVKEEIVASGAGNSPKLIRCTVTLNKEEIGSAQGFSEKEAKSLASENALQFLQNNFYTVKVKNEIGESFVISCSHVLNAENPSNILSDSNVGCKLMKMMGWTGGGIGKTGGITEPIVANDHRFGQGLGFCNQKAKDRSFKQKIETLLRDYSRSNTTSDLIFSTEFSKEERKEIHRLAMKYNLLNVSRGKGEQRQLFLSRRISPMELLERLIEAGGSTPKYELEDRSVSQ